MRDELAEALLAKVMGWTDEEKALERPILQDLARYKYDEYQQYAPGRRFIESLALWLRQFETKDAKARGLRIRSRPRNLHFYSRDAIPC